MDFNPSPAASNAFQSMFGDKAETSPVGGYAGCSHFGFVNPANVKEKGTHPLCRKIFSQQVSSSVWLATWLAKPH